MALVSRNVRFALQKNVLRSFNALPVLLKRHYCEPIRYWKPGPPPTTKEEHEAAAKKYNLIPEDYVPFSPEHGLGDYPNLPPASMDSRDPYYPWDNYYDRRNFGETMVIDWNTQTSEVYDPNREYRHSYWTYLLWFSCFVGVFSAIYYLNYITDFRFNHTRKPKQYPGPGKIHYTFEPAHD